jgi:two-component system response regulator YesN
MRLSKITQLRPSEIKAINGAIAYVKDHYKDDVTAEDLASLFDISTKKLYKGIKAKVGMTLRDYHTNARMEKAKELLEDQELPVKFISMSVGYKSQSYFTQVFKSMTGATPLEYRFKEISLSETTY